MGGHPLTLAAATLRSLLHVNKPRGETVLLECFIEISIYLH